MNEIEKKDGAVLKILILFSLLLSTLMVSCLGEELDASQGEKRTISDLEDWRGALCVTKGEGDFQAFHRGLKSEVKKSPITDKTLFGIASCSKMMVGAAIVRLAEMGKLKIDDPVTKVIPELKNKNATWEKVTIRHLTDHLAGNGEFYNTEFYKKNMFQKRMVFSDILEHLGEVAFVATPSEKFNYSNLGYILLGEVIAKASGQSLHEFFQE